VHCVSSPPHVVELTVVVALSQAVVWVQPPPNVHAGLPPPAVVLHAAALAGEAGHVTAAQLPVYEQPPATVPVLHSAVVLSFAPVSHVA
jgi:hypothetical protein